MEESTVADRRLFHFVVSRAEHRIGHCFGVAAGAPRDVCVFDDAARGVQKQVVPFRRRALHDVNRARFGGGLATV